MANITKNFAKFCKDRNIKSIAFDAADYETNKSEYRSFLIRMTETSETPLETENVFGFIVASIKEQFETTVSVGELINRVTVNGSGHDMFSFVLRMNTNYETIHEL